MTRIASSCKTQVSWCLLVPQIRKMHKAQLNKEALVLLLQLSLSCVFFFFGGICFSSQAALDSGASFFENQLPQETHYREICRFAMDLFWFKKTVLWALPVLSKIHLTQMTKMIKILYLCAFREEHSKQQSGGRIPAGYRNSFVFQCRR